MVTLDLKTQLKEFYQSPIDRVVLVDVPEWQFLMIDGKGDPNTSQDYKDAVEALYSLAYTLKFALKKRQGIDYPVLPLEGLWWTPDPAQFSLEAKDDWLWTMLLMQPECVTSEQVETGREEMKKKKHLPALEQVRLERFLEGRAAQILHLGPYAAEAPTIARLHDFIKNNGYQMRGKHHEIYLGDSRRAAPEKLRTVIRQPIEAAR